MSSASTRVVSTVDWWWCGGGCGPCGGVCRYEWVRVATR